MPQQTQFSLSRLHIKDLNGQDLILKILNILPFMTTRQAVNPIFCILKIYAKNAEFLQKKALWWAMMLMRIYAQPSLALTHSLLQTALLTATTKIIRLTKTEVLKIFLITLLHLLRNNFFCNTIKQNFYSISIII